ncbi:unnamed protein product [Mycena citricolor]|uniref:Uncharacterized protein n=1 Tax=Mycena citricolor TaxID=2018698 RepID=A0AAD2HHW8_9AGAR|nr:unnamed protein product [Mycena citricolor]
MPPRQAKILQLLIKTYRLTVLTTIAPTATVADLKADVLSALSSEVHRSSADDDMPEVTSVEDFEICKGVKTRGKLTGEFTALTDSRQTLRDADVVNWEALFVQFRDSESGDLLPVIFHPYEDDEEEVTPQFAQAEASATRGKRKAPPE